MSKKKLSVVVPIYNTENYLIQCIDSIIEQNIENMEIILVDDGSTDNSFNICKKYEEKYLNIKVIRTENNGQQAARSVGIENSEGEYLCFIDSDDWIDNNMFSDLIKEIDEVDLVTSGIVRHNKENKVADIWTDLIPAKMYKTKDEMRYVIENLIISKVNKHNVVIGGITNNIFGKIYRTEIVKKIYSIVNVGCRLEEDFLFNIVYILNCNSVKVTYNTYYHYRMNMNSVCNQQDCNFLTDRNIFYKTFINAIAEHEMKDYLKIQMDKRITYVIMCGLPVQFEFSRESIPPRYIIPLLSYYNNKKIVIFGAGNVGISFYKIAKRKNIVVAWIDNYLTNDGVSKPNIIINMDFDFVICATLKKEKALNMKKQLIEMGINENKIIWEEPEDCFRILFLES